MVLKITKVNRKLKSEPDLQFFGFRGESTMNQPIKECHGMPGWKRLEVLKLLSCFKKALPMMDLSEHQMRKKEYQSHFRLRKKMLRREKMGGYGNCSWWYDFFMGFKWIQEDLGKMSPIKLSNLLLFLNLHSILCPGWAQHTSMLGICSVSWPKVFGVLWIFDWFFWGKLQPPANCELSPTSWHFGVDNLFRKYGGIWHRDSLQGLPENREIQLRTNGLVPQVTIPFLTLR